MLLVFPSLSSAVQLQGCSLGHQKSHVAFSESRKFPTVPGRSEATVPITLPGFPQWSASHPVLLRAVIN